MPPRVLISTSSFGAADAAPLAMLETAGFEWRLNPHGRRLESGELASLLDGVTGLIAGTERIDRSVLAGATALRAISRCGTGADNVDLEAAAERGVRVLTTRHAHAVAVAELALGGLLSLLRRIHSADAAVRDGRWEKPMGGLLAGRAVGLVGCGRVGNALADRLLGFGVEILVCDPALDGSAAAALGAERLELDELLRRADVVSLHLPHSAATHHLLDRRRLGLLKSGAILVNTARGGLVDESALLELLDAGRIGGAYLDVFEDEPYAGPLTGSDRVLLTPHIGSYAAEARVAMETEAVGNLLEALGVPEGARHE